MLHKIIYNVLIVLGLLHPHCTENTNLALEKVTAWEMVLLIRGTVARCHLHITFSNKSMSLLGEMS